MPIPFSAFVAQQKSGTLPSPAINSSSSIKAVPSFSDFLAKTTPPPVPSQPNFFQKIWNGMSNVFNNITQNVISAKPPPVPSTAETPIAGGTSIGVPQTNTKIGSPPQMSTLQKVEQAGGQSLLSAFQNVQNMGTKLNADTGKVDISNLTTGQKVGQRVADNINFGLSLLGVAFQPLILPFQEGAQLPGVAGQIFQDVNDAFSKTNDIAQPSAEAIVNSLPVSTITKQNLLTPVQGVLSTMMQFGLGALGVDEVKPKLDDAEVQIKTALSNDKNTPTTASSFADWKAKGEPETPTQQAPEAPTTPPEAIKPAEPTVSRETPSATSETAPTQYPTIHQGGVIKMVEGTPVKIIDGVDTFIHKDENGNYVVSEATTGRSLTNGGYENQSLAIKAATETIDNNGGADAFKKAISENQIPAEKLPASSKAESKPATGMVNVRTAKSAADISTTMAERGYDALPEDEQAKYSPTTKAEQIQKVSDILKNEDDARAMIRGEKPIPTDVKGQVLWNAVEKLAMQREDPAMIDELAKSPLASKRSIAAQELGASGFNNNPHSPTEAVREITQAREADYLKKSGQSAETAKNDIVKAEKAKMKTEIKSNLRPRQTWAEFTRELLTCKS